MRALVSMIIMTVLWNRRMVTIFQKGKIVAIGKVVHISDHWVNITCVMMADKHGDIIKRPKLAVSRSRVDLFWTYTEGEEELLQPLGNGNPKVTNDDDPDED
jgi:hypothetical protein